MSILEALRDSKKKASVKDKSKQIIPTTCNLVDNYQFHGLLGQGISGQVFRVKNKLTYQMKALKIVQISDHEIAKRIEARLQQLSYFTDYKQICSIKQHDVKDYTVEGKAK